MFRFVIFRRVFIIRFESSFTLVITQIVLIFFGILSNNIFMIWVQWKFDNLLLILFAIWLNLNITYQFLIIYYLLLIASMFICIISFFSFRIGHLWFARNVLIRLNFFSHIMPNLNFLLSLLLFNLKNIWTLIFIWSLQLGFSVIAISFWNDLIFILIRLNLI